MKYSGRTTAHAHKFDDWQSKVIENPVPAVSQMTVFNAQWTDCPVEVEEEVKKLWRDQELGNDHFYFSWDTNTEFCTPDDEDEPTSTLGEQYPLIAEYLASKGVTTCLIHWWW